MILKSKPKFHYFFKLGLLKRNKFWIFFAIFSGVNIAIFTYFFSSTNENDTLYLLSTISQGLAAIFTLVFTITIFGAQMMKTFTAIDKMIDKWTIILMLIFASGIILPLIQLSTNEDILNLQLIKIRAANLGLAIDLGIATFCVIAIIPYLIKVNRILKYDGGISKLSEEAVEAIDSNHKATVLNRINELIDLGNSAVDDALSPEVIKIITGIKKLGISVVDKGWDDITFTIFDGLEQIAFKSAEKKLDFVITEVLLAIKEIANPLSKNSILTLNSIYRLRKIGEKAIDNDLSDNETLESPLGIGNIAINASKNRLKSEVFFLEVINELTSIAKMASQKKNICLIGKMFHVNTQPN